MAAECINIPRRASASSSTCSAFCLQRCKLFTIRASQLPPNHKDKFYKELDVDLELEINPVWLNAMLLPLKKKIEDSILRAEMMASPALEIEEARQIEQEEVIREHNVWDDLAKSDEIFAKLVDRTKVIDSLRDLRYKAEEAKLITDLAEMDTINYGLFKQAYAASIDLNKFLNKYEMSKHLRDPFDIEGACITIESKSEGSQIWVEQLKQMYMKWAHKCERVGRIVERSWEVNVGEKSVTIEFESKFSYGYLSGERGVHHLVRRPKNGSSFPEVYSAAVDVIPLFLESAPDLSIGEKDLQVLVSSYEEQGRSFPLVRIDHIPTGLRVDSVGERSHFGNKIKALNRLKAKLLIVMRDQQVSDVASIKRADINNLWSQETRRYLSYPNKLVEDVKTGIQCADLNAILNGNIETLLGAHISSRAVVSDIT
ncbi:hypothetical protein Leryth_027001 [Lithospermum erythrorhizon]|nr:hypothetical protein Leryth_027001 [Lithospermum erythrorhizon]